MLQVSFNPFPEIQTERLLLRRITNDDAEQVFKLRSDKMVMKYVGKKPAVAIDQAMDFIYLVSHSLVTNSGITWAITERNDPKSLLIGTIGLWRLIKENYRAEIGYMLLPEYWRKGFTKEAMQKIIDYGFNRLKLHSIEAHISPANTGSSAILASTGFVREAYFKEDFFFNGVFEDTAIYSLLSKNSPA